MECMFCLASAFNQPLGDWSVDNITDICSMFYNASAFNQPLGGWIVDKVTTMEQMFAYASSLSPTRLCSIRTSARERARP